MRSQGRRVALYLKASTTKRVSTADGEDFRQRPEIQEEQLRRLCDQRGWEVVAVYTDRASGRKEQRPELQRLMADARRGEFDIVAVAAFDRFARSTRHLVLASARLSRSHDFGRPNRGMIRVGALSDDRIIGND